MITNRNSTTIAPAYTITCTAARKWASIATNSTATPNSVSTRLSAACTGWRVDDHADRAADHHHRRDDEDEQLHLNGLARYEDSARSACLAALARLASGRTLDLTSHARCGRGPKRSLARLTGRAHPADDHRRHHYSAASSGRGCRSRARRSSRPDRRSRRRPTAPWPASSRWSARPRPVASPPTAGAAAGRRRRRASSVLV